ncbi:MAG TPA: DUF4222 domain-containing protein [Buttiauxella sp.]|nr:DUF4222 domain-containing protein [Buttiauxella sp.]
MRNTDALFERFKAQLQRNYSGTESCLQVREVAAGDRFKDGYGRLVTVIAVSPNKVIFRRDGYDQNCEMRWDKFLKEFVEADV